MKLPLAGELYQRTTVNIMHGAFQKVVIESAVMVGSADFPPFLGFSAVDGRINCEMASR